MDNWPRDLAINPQIKKVYKARYEAIKNQSHVDYGLAEVLAYGSLLLEGYGVKLNG